MNKNQHDISLTDSRLKRLGIWGFGFFLIKGITWLIFSVSLFQLGID
jgi:hypothetical protein